MTLRQSEKQGTILVEKPVSPQPITSIQQIVEDASSWPVVDGVKQKDGFAYCDGSTLVNTSGTYDDFNTANGSLVLPNGPFKSLHVDQTVLNVTVTGATVSGTPVVNAFTYTDTEGSWRFTFNITGVVNPTDASFDVNCTGVTFKTGAFQGVTSSGAVSNETSKAYANSGSNNIRVDHEAATSVFRLSGDVELDSKPTWADANLESYPVVSLQSNIANAIGIPEATATQAGTVKVAYVASQGNADSITLSNTGTVISFTLTDALGFTPTTGTFTTISVDEPGIYEITTKIMLTVGSAAVGSRIDGSLQVNSSTVAASIQYSLEPVEGFAEIRMSKILNLSATDVIRVVLTDTDNDGNIFVYNGGSNEDYRNLDIKRIG